MDEEEQRKPEGEWPYGAIAQPNEQNLKERLITVINESEDNMWLFKHWVLHGEVTLLSVCGLWRIHRIASVEYRISLGDKQQISPRSIVSGG
jgi:hypothetical protein